MPDSITIALDAMSGDHGPGIVVEAAGTILKRHPNVRLILVGDEAVLREKAGACGVSEGESLQIKHATEVVSMDERPSQALRTKKDSSMRVAVNLVKEGVANAAVSAGNTGALMATARYVLKTLPGIDRPAIIFAFPCIEGHTRVLDLGANVDCTAEHLFQFGVMGSVLAEALDGIERPRVGLLNIGQEEIKGNEQVKGAAHMLSESKLNYIGYVEGDDILKGGADVIVCDGFVGNVAVKTIEGLATAVSYYLRKEFQRNFLTKLAALIAMPVLKGFRRRLDTREYNGGSLLGLRGIVIKSHGSADAYSFSWAIETAIKEVEEAVPTRIDQRLATVLAERQAE